MVECHIYCILFVYLGKKNLALTHEHAEEDDQKVATVVAKTVVQTVWVKSTLEALFRLPGQILRITSAQIG